MINYHFTNDMRFAQVDENLYLVAKHLKTGIWEHPSQSLRQAKNGWYPVYTFYFGLYEGAHNVDLILEGKSKFVLGEFIKKFQYPNPKGDRANSFQTEIENQQLNAPLRTLLQLLFYGVMYENVNFISKDAFKKYILANEAIAKNAMTIGTLFSEIREGTLDGIDFHQNISVSGGDPDRFCNQLLGVIEPLGYISLNDDKIVLNIDNVQGEDKAILFDIISYNEFWMPIQGLSSGEQEQSYKEYMQSKMELSNFEAVSSLELVDIQQKLQEISQQRFNHVYSEYKYRESSYAFFDNRVLFNNEHFSYLGKEEWSHFLSDPSGPDTEKITTEELLKLAEEHFYKKNPLEGLELDSIVGKNVIYYGAPGTGKSYGVTQQILKTYPNFGKEDSEQSQYVFRTTLHPEYTYSDFVGQVMPKVTSKGIKYEFSQGVFTRALEKAIAYEKLNVPVYLVLEELSRANVAAVFGDLFQLLDRKEGKSEYPITHSIIAKSVYHLSNEEAESEKGNRKIYIPRNLFIFGTVNTNDQNVFVMDTAFKRRFSWRYVSTKPANEKNNPYVPIVDADGSIGQVTWHEFYQALNRYITKEMELGEDKQIGQFFIQFTADNQANKSEIQNKLLHYIWDDVNNVSFSGRKLFAPSVENFSDLYDKFSEDKNVFNSDFITELLNSVVFDQTDSSSDKVQLTDSDIFNELGDEALELLNTYELNLEKIKKENGWTYDRKPMNYHAFKYFVDINNNRSGFLQVEKGRNGDLLQVSFRKEFVEGEIPKSRLGRPDRKSLFETVVQVSTIEEFEFLNGYIEESWRKANGTD